MFSGNIYYRGDKTAAEQVLHEATQLANSAEAKKAYLGVPNFREQVTLSSGATLDIVLGEHTQFITIVGFGGEVSEEVSEEEEFEVDKYALFTFIPKADYPRAVIYRDTTEGSGFALIFEEDVRAGNAYSHFPDRASNEYLLSFETYGTRPAMGGHSESVNCDNKVYTDTYRLTQAVSSGVVIGAAVVSDAVFCFVTSSKTAGLVRFYSHPTVEIDFDNTDHDTELIDWDDVVLVHTEPLPALPEGDNDNSTIATFNSDGTIAVIGVLEGATTTETQQHIWTVTLEVVGSSFTVDIDDAVQGVKITGEGTYYAPTPISSTSLGNTYTVPGLCGNMTWSTYRAYTLGDDQRFERATSYTTPAYIGVAVNGAGVTSYATYTEEQSVINYGWDVGTAYRDFGGPFHTLSLNIGATVSGFAAVEAIIAANPLPILVTVPFSTVALGGRFGFIPIPEDDGLTKSDTEAKDYILPWGTLATASEHSSVNTDYYPIGAGNSAPAAEAKRKLSLPGAGDPDPDTCYGIACDCPITEEEYTVDNVLTKNGQRSEEIHAPGPYSLREGVGFSYHYTVPNRVVYHDDGTWNSQGDAEWYATSYVSRYITIDLPDGNSVDIPGLPAFHRNSAEGGLYVTNIGAMQPSWQYDPLLGPIEEYAPLPYLWDYIKVHAAFHPKGYVLYSLNDYEIQRHQAGWDSVTGETTAVLGLYDIEENTFVNVLEMYNDELVRTESLKDPLDPVMALGDQGEDLNKFLVSYGLLNRVGFDLVKT